MNALRGIVHPNFFSQFMHHSLVPNLFKFPIQLYPKQLTVAIDFYSIFFHTMEVNGNTLKNAGLKTNQLVLFGNPALGKYWTEHMLGYFDPAGWVKRFYPPCWVV